MKSVALLIVLLISFLFLIKTDINKEIICFGDISTINPLANHPNAPFSTKEMINALTTSWALSKMTDVNKCEHYPYLYGWNDTLIYFPNRGEFCEPNNIEIRIDTTTNYSISLNMLEPIKYKKDTINNQLIRIRKTDITHVSSTTFYLINAQKRSILLSTMAGIPLIIQEAIDTNGNWRPIEYWQGSFCGNAYYPIKMPPMSYLTGGVVKYTGDFETKLRLKLKDREKIFYSPIFKGKINLEQFELREEHQILKESKDYLFLTPNERCVR